MYIFSVIFVKDKFNLCQVFFGKEKNSFEKFAKVKLQADHDIRNKIILSADEKTKFLRIKIKYCF